MSWYKLALQRYAEFGGRSRRKEYWMFFLINLLVMLVIGTIDAVVGTMGILSVVYILGTLIPNIALTVRRLHDTGRSAWWLLITFVPFIGSIVFIVFMCLEGQDKDNDWGADPKLA
ncbi:DUF805 domain-containing protein [Thaumasiovibrio subtropicus]|uniref:DUF805 domain-containing protein n=1 Tax=Thaumasiovibrio subtropicus TaxID=1891207 RepID=UPI000B350078|nr:DUF805 domain-containing protein [Thaumasiovibrio subtropicus]